MQIELGRRTRHDFCYLNHFVGINEFARERAPDVPVVASTEDCQWRELADEFGDDRADDIDAADESVEWEIPAGNVYDEDRPKRLLDAVREAS